MGSRQQNKKTIVGVLHAEDKNSDGMPITLKFATAKDGILIVEQNKIWSDLVQLEQKRLAVKGKLRQRIDGNTVISINQFQLLGNDDE